MNPVGRRFVGVDIGGTNIKAIATTGAVGNADLERRRASRCPTRAPAPPEVVLDRVVDLVDQVGDGPVAALGVALPGNVAADTGTAVYVPALGDAWEGHAVGERLGERLGAPVIVLNDVHAMTLAESSLGAARGAQEALCVAVGTGVGGGLVLGGRLHTGPSGTAGAIGHTTVEPDGPACVCGNRGCLELYASGPAIARTSGHLTAAATVAAARHGDPAAIDALTSAGRYLGIAVANVATMVTPSHVVVGGGVGAAGDLLLWPLRAELQQRVRVASLDGTQVLPAACGDEAGALGAALAASGALIRRAAEPATGQDGAR